MEVNMIGTWTGTMTKYPPSEVVASGTVTDVTLRITSQSAYETWGWFAAQRSVPLPTVSTITGHSDISGLDQPLAGFVDSDGEVQLFFYSYEMFPCGLATIRGFRHMSGTVGDNDVGSSTLDVSIVAIHDISPTDPVRPVLP